MFTFLPARWLATLPALAAFAAGAQIGPAPNSSTANESAAPPSFKSAMEGYKAFADEKPVPWRQANDTARERGGWRAYAKESADEPEGKPSAAADPHAGHSMPMPKRTPPRDKP